MAVQIERDSNLAVPEPLRNDLRMHIRAEHVGCVRVPQIVELRGGPGCLNRFSASISGASAGVRLPSGVAAG
jgi:hypothetical protein